MALSCKYKITEKKKKRIVALILLLYDILIISKLKGQLK